MKFSLIFSQLFFLLWTICAWSQTSEYHSDQLSRTYKEWIKDSKQELVLENIQLLEDSLRSIGVTLSPNLLMYKALAANKIKHRELEESTYRRMLGLPSMTDSLRCEVLFNMSNCLYYRGKLSEAITCAKNARESNKVLYTEEHQKYIRCLNSLGQFHKELSQLSEAEKVFLEAKKLNLRVAKGSDMQYARIINNLGDVYTSLHRFEKAEEYYQISLGLKKKQGDDADYAKTLYNLAKFYYTIGKYTFALEKVDEAIRLSPGKLDETKLKMMDLRAIVLDKTGSSKEAEKIFRELISYRESLQMSDRQDYALNLMSLANLFLDQKRADSCIYYIQKAMKSFSRMQSDQHIYYAYMLGILADAEALTQNYAVALTQYEKAAAILVKQLGKDGKEHMDYFTNQFHYARTLRKMGQTAKAKALFKQIDDIPKKYLERVSGYLSETELEKLTLTIKAYHEELYSFNKQIPADADLCKLSYNNALFYKGYIQQSLIKLRKGVSQSADIVELKEQWLQQNQQLDLLMRTDSVSASDIEGLKRGIAQTDFEMQAKLKAQKVGDQKQTSWEDVQFVLGSREVAVEFVEFSTEGVNELAALIIKPDSTAPVFVSLVQEAVLQDLVQPSKYKTTSFNESIYEFQMRGLVPLEEKKVSLYDILWKPLSAHIPRGSTLYFSAAGLMHRISNDAIPISYSELLTDLYDLRQLSSTRMLATQEERFLEEEPDEVLLVGLGFDEEAKTNGNMPVWEPLPRVKSEVEGIAKLCAQLHKPYHILLGSKATEPGLTDKILASRRGFNLLHIATHAYFQNTEDSPALASRSSQASPLLSDESGIILSGSHPLEVHEDPRQDGVWTSAEIGRLDLQDTRLVVLSACETGLGSIKTHEGVYGLQRAFRIAGARSMIISLWKVVDGPTHDFMMRFYNHYLEKKRGVREAFRLAQQEMRKEHKYSPKLWAGFVLVE